MKKIIAVLIISLSIFLIYYFNRDTEVYYVSLGAKENNYYESVEAVLLQTKKLETSKFGFLKNDAKIETLQNQIDNNVKVNNQTIKNALIKADLVTIYLKTDIISDNEADFSKVDEEAKRFEALLKDIKGYCKETIIVIGPDDTSSGSLKYLNKTFRNVTLKYNIHYIKMENSEQLSSNILKKIGIKPVNNF